MAGDVKGKRPYNARLRQEQAEITRSRILDAARRLLSHGTYSSVTMEEIAVEAGVSHHTVYAVFKTKLRLAQEIIRVGFHVVDVEALAAPMRASQDPEIWLRGTAQISRHIQEHCADLLRFMRESGDPELLARYREHQALRFKQEDFLPAALKATGRLRPGLSDAEVLSIIWSMTGPDIYSMLVFDQSWTPSRYEQWLGSALIDLLLDGHGSPPGSKERG